MIAYLSAVILNILIETNLAKQQSTDIRFARSCESIFTVSCYSTPANMPTMRYSRGSNLRHPDWNLGALPTEQHKCNPSN
eukprot:c21906_g2_i1 orf=87-326(-)